MTPRYRVTTWDSDLQEFTPQKGVRASPLSKWELRRALRKLQGMGYDPLGADCCSVYVERISGKPPLANWPPANRPYDRWLRGQVMATGILHRRYVKDDPLREQQLATERLNASVARLIYRVRVGALMTQEALARRVGTTQSVISRLEDSDYEGHSLSMLCRIATVLNKRVEVTMSSAT